MSFSRYKISSFFQAADRRSHLGRGGPGRGVPGRGGPGRSGPYSITNEQVLRLISLFTSSGSLSGNLNAHKYLWCVYLSSVKALNKKEVFQVDWPICLCMKDIILITQAILRQTIKTVNMSL